MDTARDYTNSKNIQYKLEIQASLMYNNKIERAKKKKNEILLITSYKLSK